MRFLMYDVETANSKITGSICGVGWCLIDNGVIAARGSSLIDPRVPFSQMCVKVHGIRKEDVYGAPTFGDYWRCTLAAHAENSVIVAHNASFDMRHTEQALFDWLSEDIALDYFDFLPVTRALLPDLPDHRLSTLAQWAGYEFSHHDAAEDAAAIYHVSCAICRHLGYSCFEEMFIRSREVLRNTLNDNYIPQCNTFFAAEPDDNALEGICFCFTGDIPGVDRDSAERKVLAHGGTCKGSVSRRTSILVRGVYEDYGNDYISSKCEKALELMTQGFPIIIISAEQFLCLIDSPFNSKHVTAVREAQQRVQLAAKAEAARKAEEAAEKEARKAERDARKAASEARKADREASKSRRIVQQLDAEGNVIAEYKSVTVAAATVSVDPKGIRNAATGVQRTAAGFRWRYVSTESGARP